MRQYGYLQAIYMSFYSRKFYRDVANNWGANILLYLLLLLAICWICLMARLQPAINRFAVSFISNVFVQLPADIQFKNGMIKTTENKPYVIRDLTSQNGKEIIAIIDTSGKYKNLNQAKAPLLVTTDSVIYSGQNNLVKIRKLPESLNFNFKSLELRDRLIKFTYWMWLLLFPGLLIFSFLYRLVQSLVYSVFGKIFSLLMHADLAYVQIIRLTIAAITPAIVVGTAADFFSITFSYSWLLYFVLSIGYLIFAIRACIKSF